MEFPAVVTEEALTYEQREAASPESGEFVGGHHGLFPGLLLLAIIFVLVLVIIDKKD